MNATAVTARTLAISGVIACGLGVLGASAASATVYFDNAFETETPNTSAGTPNAGYNIGRGPVNTGSYALDGGMTLPTGAKNDTTAGGRGAAVFAANPATTGFSSQAVGLFTHPSTYGGGNEGKVYIEHTPAVNGPLTGTTTGQYVFSFDLSVASTTLDTSTWTVKPAMSLKANYFGDGFEWWLHGGNQTILSVWENQGNLILTSADITGASTDTTILTGFTALTPYHIAATLDMDNATFTLAVDGAPVGGTFNQLVPEILGKGIGEYLANGGQPNTGSPEGFLHFYDNINLQSVPEPATLSILGLSTAGLLLRRKRH